MKEGRKIEQIVTYCGGTHGGCGHLKDEVKNLRYRGKERISHSCMLLIPVDFHFSGDLDTSVTLIPTYICFC